jgi:hopanoid biosynthesis associated protein HpnK
VDRDLTTSRRRLIVSADDFGMSPGVNAGILRAHREGILTDVGLMVNGQAFDEAVGLARSTPTLSVGLHLTLAQGRATAAAAEIPLLADRNGLFRMNPIWSGMRFFFLPGIRAQLRREIRAQLDKFQATGLPLSHVDGHVTIHAHPTVLAILIDCAPDYGIRAVRLPREPLLPALRFDARHLGRKLFEATVFAALSRHARKRLAVAGISHPERMFGLHQTGRISERYLLTLLPQLPDGTSELYCHAALADDECRRWRPADYESEQEVAALTSPRVKAEIERQGIELIPYSLLQGLG